MNGVQLENIAGVYEAMTDPNGEGYQAYQLKDCSNGASIYYSATRDEFIIYSDLLTSYDYVFRCTTSGTDFTNCDEYTEYNFASYNLFVLQEISSGDSCSCGQSIGGSSAVQPHGVIKINDNDVIDNGIKSVGIWESLSNALKTETGGITMIVILLLMLVWTAIMCAYQFGVVNKRKNKFSYRPAKVIDDQV